MKKQITEKMLEEALQRYDAGEETLKSIAADMGVSYGALKTAKYRKSKDEKNISDSKETPLRTAEIGSIIDTLGNVMDYLKHQQKQLNRLNNEVQAIGGKIGVKVENASNPFAKKKRCSPSDFIEEILKKGPCSRLEIEGMCHLNEEQILKAIGWMRKNNLVEKIKEKDDNGNSKWKLL